MLKMKKLALTLTAAGTLLIALSGCAGRYSAGGPFSTDSVAVTPDPSLTSIPSPSGSPSLDTSQALAAFRKFAADQSIDGKYSISYVTGVTAREAEQGLIGDTANDKYVDLLSMPAIAIVAVGDFNATGFKLAPGSTVEPKHYLTRIAVLPDGATLASGLQDEDPNLSDLGTPVQDIKNQ